MSAHERYFCRACETAALTAEARAFIQEYLDSLPEADCVSDDVYRQRLRQCSLCRYCLADGTCDQCGCLVLVRAKRKAQRCPAPEGSRWPV